MTKVFTKFATPPAPERWKALLDSDARFWRSVVRTLEEENVRLTRRLQRQRELMRKGEKHGG